jgi:hypothetical protein
MLAKNGRGGKPRPFFVFSYLFFAFFNASNDFTIEAPAFCTVVF